MTTAALFLFSGLSLQALADLRWRTAPAATLFCLAGLLFGLTQDPTRVVVTLLVLVWGLGVGADMLAPLFLLHPTTFLLMPWGYALRTHKAGLNDLLVLTGVGMAFSWPMLLLAVLGVEVWRNWWQLRRPDLTRMPVVPGIAFGCSVYFLFVVA